MQVASTNWLRHYVIMAGMLGIIEIMTTIIFHDWWGVGAELATVIITIFLPFLWFAFYLCLYCRSVGRVPRLIVGVAATLAPAVFIWALQIPDTPNTLMPYYIMLAYWPVALVAGVLTIPMSLLFGDFISGPIAILHRMTGESLFSIWIDGLIVIILPCTMVLFLLRIATGLLLGRR